MKINIYNQRQLEVATKDIWNKFEEYQCIALDYGKPFKEKTKKQLGFYFGGIVDSVYGFEKSLGNIYSYDEIKENFYQACSKIDERLVKTVRQFDGKEYQVSKRLSEMDIEEASVFIDKTIWLIDNAKHFQSLILHPSLRYTWVRNITDEDIFSLKALNFQKEDREFLDHTRKQACLICGKQNESQIHHLRISNLGGTALKPPDWATIPLCQDCHLGLVHQQGNSEMYKNLEWITKYINLIDFCRIRYNKWKNKL